MKKEISFYEFVGILIPGSILLYGINFMLEAVRGTQLFDISKIGETIIFFVLSYAVGHFIQAIANIFEWIVWGIYGGMPTNWLMRKNRFNKNLFEDQLNTKIRQKVIEKYGDIKEPGRLVYNFIFLAGKSGRIDVFNGNYSLFRGLSIGSLLLALAVIFQYHLNYWQSALALVPFILMTRRMIRFARYYATETFRTFYNL